MDFKNIFGKTIELGDTSYVERVEGSARRLKDFFEKSFNQFGIPKFAIVLGTSGPKGLLKILDSKKVVDYSQLGFPISKEKGHAPERDGGPEAKVHYGLLAGVPVLICVGRIHYYECQNMDLVTLMVRSICLLGIKDFIITNASGTLYQSTSNNTIGSRAGGYSAAVGDIIPITDFINEMGDNPLMREQDYFHTFTDPNKVLYWGFVKKIYDYNPKHTTYIAVPGRPFESRAEAKKFAQYGDLMGMSSVPELFAIAQQEGRVLLLSLVTNEVASFSSRGDVTHENNLNIVQEKDEEFSRIILNFVSSFKE